MNIGIYPQGTNVTDAVIAMARTAGCNCNPEVQRPNRTQRRAGIDHVTVHHDDWCHLLSRIERRN